MGFVWYFEIIGFLAYSKDDEKESDFWWLPDTLNMLQVYLYTGNRMSVDVCQDLANH